jgi:DNA-binding response OmpR family regulator
MPHIYLIADDTLRSQALARALKRQGYAVESRSVADAILSQAPGYPCDCVVIDLEHSDRRVATKLSGSMQTWLDSEPVLLVASKSIVEEVPGLADICDEHLAKPATLAQLFAAVEALLGSRTFQTPSALTLESLQVDEVRRRVAYGANAVTLTRREFELFAYLLRHKNQAVSRAMLGRDIWDEPDYSLTNVIDVYINFLRRKLDSAGLPRLIHTLRGVGYMLREPETDPVLAGAH